MPRTRSWRRVLGAFQLSVPADAKEQLLPREERDFAVLRWIGEAIPTISRWYLVFNRYLEVIASRVKEFGGDPTSIQPSPTGDGKTKGNSVLPSSKGDRKTMGHPDEEEDLCFTGKVGELIYDRFGDFEGFLLCTVRGEHTIRSREKEIARLIERVWHERLRITVCSGYPDAYCPSKIIVHQPSH